MVFSRRNSPPRRDLMALVEALGIPALHQIAPQCDAELRRARRHERPLSVVFISVEGSDGENGDQGSRFPMAVSQAAPGTFTAFLLLGSFLLRSLREEDILASSADGLRYVITMPESDGLGVQRALRRLSDDFTAYTSLPLRTGMAEFPNDGVTLDTLVEHANRAWETGRLEDPGLPEEPDLAEAREA